MKKFKLLIMTVIFVFFTISFGGIEKAYADEEGPMVDISVEGGEKSEFKAGNDVTIKIDISNVSNLFAGSFIYTYDNTLIKIDSVDINDDIQSAGVYEPYKDTAKDGNKARYCFTLLGDNPGFSGNYNLATIKGKALKDGQISVGADNIQFQLINRKDNAMERANYSFTTSKGDIYKVTNLTEESKKAEEGKKTDESLPKTSTVNGKSDTKVELVKKADDATEKKDEGEDSKQEVESDNLESNSSLDSEDNENKKEKDDLKEDNIDKKENNTLVLGGAVVIIFAVAATIIYIKKSKKGKNNI